MPPQPRSGPSSSPAGPSSSAQAAANRGLQLARGRGVPITRHVPFDLGEGERTGGKANSNTINAEGKYNTVACLQCVGAVAFFDKHQVVGRMAGKFNEYFSCIVHPTLGSGGTQCGRCVGLGKGGECGPPPEDAQKAARAVVASAAAYNRVLASHPTETYGSLTETDQASVMTCVENSKKFNGVVDGLRKLGKVEATPSKKRKHSDLVAGDSLNNINLAMSRNAGTTEERLIALSSLVREQTGLIISQGERIEVLERRSVVARGRERWMCDAVDELIIQGNDMARRTNADLDDDATVHVIKKKAFDGHAFDLESDAEEDDDMA